MTKEFKQLAEKKKRELELKSKQSNSNYGNKKDSEKKEVKEHGTSNR